jgi:uncharacterized protein YecT (DUF1311 family)
LRADERNVEIAERKQVFCEEGNMLQTTFCMVDELHESDARLNVVYAALIDALKDPAPLRKAQHSWLAFRDAECEFDTAGWKTGSGAKYTADLCLMRMTEQRILTLENLGPCNGCIEFKSQYYQPTGFQLPERKRIQSLPPIPKPGED